MTNDEIMTFEAGREMDALVAEKVLGWRWYDGRGTAGPSYWETQDGEFAHFAEFEPSTDIAAAWEVVEKMITGTAYECYLTHQTKGWYCSFQHPGAKGGQMQADTIELAICQAALLAAMEKQA